VDEIALVFKRTLNAYIQSMASRFPDYYGTMKETDVRVLFVIEDEERNICDKKWIEHQIYQAHKIKSMRMTFS